MSKITNWIPSKVIMYRKKKKRLGGFDSFPLRYDATDESKQTAIAWTKDTWRGRNNKQTLVGDNPIEVSNAPRRGFKIVDAEQRSNGGRAWKVLTPDNDLVDMREDVFLPILLDRGLPNTKIIDAEFQWVQCGSQLKLIEVGSPFHKTCQAEEERLEKKAVKKQKSKQKMLKEADLVVGNMYYFGEAKSVVKLYLGKLSMKNGDVFMWLDRQYQLYHRSSDTFKAWGIQSQYSLTCTATEECTAYKPPQNFLKEIDIYRNHIYKVTKLNSWCAVVERTEMFNQKYSTRPPSYYVYLDLFEDFMNSKWLN